MRLAHRSPTWIIFTFGLLVTFFVVATVGAVPTSFQWGSYSASGSTAFGVYDFGNSITLATGDLVQLIWAGSDGTIDWPNIDGLPTDDDVVLDTTTVQNLGAFPPPLQNKGYVALKTLTFDTGDAVVGGSVYLRAWNAATVTAATHYGNSVTGTLSIGGSLNVGTWQTDQAVSPTAVTLVNFAAVAQLDGSVQVTWETATEIDNVGFNLYRSATSVFDPESAAQLNAALITAQAQWGSGASYEFVDLTVASGVWYYFLEDVDLGGAVTLHEPVSVDTSVPASVGLSAVRGSQSFVLAILLTFAAAFIWLVLIRSVLRPG